MSGAVFSLLSSGLHLMRGELRSISCGETLRQRRFLKCSFIYYRKKNTHNLRHNNVMFFIYFQSKCSKQQSYLTCGAVFVVGADEVRGVGQVNEQLLMRLQSRSRKIQQENLGGNRAMSTGELLTWENFPGLFQDLRSCYSKTNR